MDVTPVIAEGQQVIRSYGAAGFTVAEQRFASSILILPDETLPWAVTRPEEITLESLAPLLGREVELLLIGCGAAQAFLSPALRQALRARGLIVDTMDTGAACRTYNVLLSEARRVAAALILP